MQFTNLRFKERILVLYVALSGVGKVPECAVLVWEKSRFCPLAHVPDTIEVEH